MAFSWDTFNSNRSGRGGFSDWGLDTSIDYGGSDAWEPFVVPVVGSGGLAAEWDPGLLRLDGFDYDPYDLWGTSPIILPPTTPTQQDTFINWPGFLEALRPEELEERLVPSDRPRDPPFPTDPYVDPRVPGLPGSQSGPSVGEPGGGGGGGGGGGDGGGGGGGGGGGVQLPSLGGLASAALGLALLRQFLGLFDRDETTYQGIDMPTVRDITAPQTPQIAPARVVPYETYAPQSRPATRFSEAPIEGLGRAEGGLASALRPHMLAVGGRADYREGAPVVGKGTGQSDDIPALLSDGEYVIDADTVAALGDGSNTAGAKVLDEFRQMIREHKRSAPADKIPPKAKSPLAYLKEAKKNG